VLVKYIYMYMLSFFLVTFLYLFIYRKIPWYLKLSSITKLFLLSF